jgi:hypothetical protein
VPNRRRVARHAALDHGQFGRFDRREQGYFLRVCLRRDCSPWFG